MWMKFVSQISFFFANSLQKQSKLCINVFYKKSTFFFFFFYARMFFRIVPKHQQIHIKCDSLLYNCFVNNLYENSNLMQNKLQICCLKTLLVLNATSCIKVVVHTIYIEIHTEFCSLWTVSIFIFVTSNWQFTKEYYKLLKKIFRSCFMNEFYIRT